MPNSDSLVTLDQILKAQSYLDGKIVRTPMIQSLNVGNLLNINLLYKAELYQKTGSFKMRGVLNKLNSLTREEKDKGVITISAGNHAKALSYASSLMNVKAIVIMPTYAPQNKIDSAKRFGAEVILTESENLVSEMNKTIEERNLTLVHPFDDPFIIAGHGTIGLEILSDVSNKIDTVIVPIGGGGLISGVATAIKLSQPEITVIGVEPEGANAMSLSLAKNEVVTLEKVDTIADGLAAPWAGDHTLAHTKKYVDGVIIVTDEEIRRAMKNLVLNDKIVAEPAGAASLAALLSGKIDFEGDQNIVCVLSGSNVDQELLKSIL
ncbi:MAG: threonine/serine dehydratase [Candidatus Kariarchaeaceae archaeon]|jgi:threonine dehydratase